MTAAPSALRLPIEYLAYIWRTASDQLAGTYPVPNEYLSNTYPTRGECVKITHD
jgi:hypothetical protein